LLTGAWFDRRRRGIAQSYVSSTQTLWMAMLGIAIPLITLAYGWRNVWYILGLVSLCFSGVVYALIRNNPKEKGLSPCGARSKGVTNSEDAILQTVSNDKVRTRDVVKMGITWHLGAIFTLTVFVLTIPTLFVVTYLITEVGLATVASGGAFSIFTLAMLVGGYTWGFISDHLPRKFVVATCSILYAASLLALISFGKEIAIIYIIIAVMGFAIGITAVTFAMIPEYFSIRILGTASGLINAISGLGLMIGPLVAGSIATITGSLVPAFQLTAVVAVALAVVSIALRKPTMPST
jgi:sugar phosphate permease